MKRRIAPKLLALLAVAVADVPRAAIVDASLLDDHHLRVRPEMEAELDALERGEFAPLRPSSHTRSLVEGRLGERRRRVAACSSPLVDWSTERIREMGYSTYKTLYDNRIIQMPYVYKHYINRHEDDNEFFVSGDQTKELQRRHRDAVSFWREADIDSSVIDASDDILLLSMHGSILVDDDKLVPAIMRVFDFDATADVMAFAAKVRRIVEDLPGGYDNPLLTMNAIATRSTHGTGTFGGHDDAGRRVKDSIIIGDGVLQFLIDSGLGSSGPDFVHAHEFGHHLQFRLDMAVPPGSAYAHDDRRKELMADAISGYFLAHDDGGDMLAEEIGVFDRTAFATGDCSEGEDDHHGTPRMRQCAAIWGASLAAPDRVPVLDPDAFVRSFNAMYPRMLDLDSGVCTLILEDPSYDGPGAKEKEDERKDPSLQDIEVGSWNEADEEGEPAVNIGDWLNSQKQDRDDEVGNGKEAHEEGKPDVNLGDWLNSQKQDKDAGDQKWEDPFETEVGGAWERPSSNNGDNNVPNSDVVSLVPIDNYSWESRGKPSSDYDHSATGPMPGARPGARPIDMGVTEGVGEDVNPYGNFADRGTTPEETKQSYMDHEMTVVDCRMPWVYCQTSSGSRQVHAAGRLLYIALAMAAAVTALPII